jgi:N,N'-diacetyllegionaminate synthase
VFKTLSNNNRCYLIAEIGQAHDGSLGMAHAYIDAVAKTGVDAIKFQTHFAEHESTKRDIFRTKFSYQDATRYDYWKRIQFPDKEWGNLQKHAREVGLDFVSTAFSNHAVDLLADLSVPFFKVGSGDLLSFSLIDHMCRYQIPIVLSSGMATLDECKTAIKFVKDKNIECAIMQCTTSYPSPPETWGLNVIGTYHDLFGIPVGFSDHSGDIFAGLAAVSAGIDLLEVHVVFSKDSFGPDSSSSLTIEQLQNLVKGIRLIETANKNPVDKDDLASTFQRNKMLFSRSAVFSERLLKGTKLKEEHVLYKKPGGGLSKSQVDLLMGLNLHSDVMKDDLVEINMFKRN